MPGSELVVSELFGPTFQGEGPAVGRRCSFLRLGGCNLHCSWCDTPYTWDWSGRNGTSYDPATELTRMSANSVWDDLTLRGADMLVITGGEPMLQQDSLLPVLSRAREARWWVEVETAGTIAPTAAVASLVDRFNVSPKLANSGNPLSVRANRLSLGALRDTGKAIWKFVVEKDADLDEVDGLVADLGLRNVYIMPEGITPEVIGLRTAELAEAVLGRGWNMTTRLQVLAYGNRRGV
ncbi:MAG: 7-carboxy-7-deazaguanine synthase QueE [Candidatus Dormibacteria bacterium]